MSKYANVLISVAMFFGTIAVSLGVFTLCCYLTYESVNELTALMTLATFPCIWTLGYIITVSIIEDRKSKSLKERK